MRYLSNREYGFFEISMLAIWITKKLKIRYSHDCTSVFLFKFREGKVNTTYIRSEEK